MNKNDVVSLEITDIGIDGEGIGRTDGYTLFVKDALVKDHVTARVVKAKKTYGYARLEKVEIPSPFRVEPKCQYHKQCGGCQIQAMDYQAQLEFKQNKVRNNMIRIGGFDEAYIDERMEPIMGMDNPWGYRNKAQYPVGTDKNGNLIAGFYAGRTHTIIANTSCHLGAEVNQIILDAILTFMQENGIPAYDENTGKGLVRHILIREGYATGEIMVCLVINGTGMPRKRELIQDLLAINLGEKWTITSICISSNTKNTNVIMGEQYEVLYGNGYICDLIGDVKFRISPLSFFQVNPVQTEKLYGTALEFAKLTGTETVWDLYCGIGTISLFLAQKAKQVYGIEVIPQAIDNARENAELNGLQNVEFMVGKAEEVLPEYYQHHSSDTADDQNSLHPDVIVVDPPRKGCDELCLSTMVSMAPKRIVYVSCDSATLARDLKYLCENGYQLDRVRPCDMFPHTVHVETVCLLSKLHEAKHHVSVKLDMDELDLTSAESKATYEEIKKYVAEHNDGMKVSSLNIAQVKRKCGIELGENFNLPKSEDSRQPQCPKEKEDAIVGALKYFKMI